MNTPSENGPPMWTYENEHEPRPERPPKHPHPICVQIRQLRRAANLSLGQVENRYGVSSVVLGAYERGDREPPLTKIDSILAHFGYRLQAVPINDEVAVRMPEDMVTALRTIANHLEHQRDLPELSDAA